MADPQILLAGLGLPEGPRWRDGRLVFSDMFAGEVVAVDMDGRRETLARLERPSGLGWLPDGRLLVVAMLDRKLLVHDAAGLAEAADLAAFTTDRCNDMVVDAKGRAYVGGYPNATGSTLEERMASMPPANLVLVDFSAGGAPRVSVAAGGLYTPNGAVITPDGATLIVAETARRRLTAFAIAPDGALSQRRVWAELDVAPDGICLDAEGCIWVASPWPPGGFQRVAEGGAVLAREMAAGLAAFACALGGPGRRTLFLLESGFPPDAEARIGRIRTMPAPAAGVGLP